MPYKTNADLPETVTVLPAAAQSIFRNVVNGQEERGLSEERAFASGWAAVQRAGYEKEGDTWVKVTKQAATLTIPIAKADDAQRRIFGWASVVRKADGEEVIDLQGDVIAIEELEEAMYDYALESGELNFDHQGEARGRLIEMTVFTPDKLSQMGIPEGTVPHGAWVGYVIPAQADYEAAKAGGKLMFSIEGSAVREEV